MQSVDCIVHVCEQLLRFSLCASIALSPSISMSWGKVLVCRFNILCNQNAWEGSKSMRDYFAHAFDWMHASITFTFFVNNITCDLVTMQYIDGHVSKLCANSSDLLHCKSNHKSAIYANEFFTSFFVPFFASLFDYFSYFFPTRNICIMTYFMILAQHTLYKWSCNSSRCLAQINDYWFIQKSI